MVAAVSGWCCEWLLLGSPWRVGGMPDNTAEISPDGSVVRLLIQDAAHHQDLRFADPADSEDLIRARQVELKHVTKWLTMPLIDGRSGAG